MNTAINLDRRTVLQAGALAAILPVTGKALAAGVGGGSVLAFVVVDERRAESFRFAKTLAPTESNLLRTSGDVTDIWYRELYPCWSKGKGGVAGLTGHDTLFCLERLAWDHRLRLAYRADHVVSASTTARHLVHGLTGEADAARKLLRSGEHWPEYAAQLVRRQTDRTVSPLAETHVGIRALSGAVGDAVPLYSWYLAPSLPRNA